MYEQHLAPQIPIETLKAQMAMNYQKAIIYYDTRLQQFLKKFEKQLNEMSKGQTIPEYENEFSAMFNQALAKYLPTTWHGIIAQVNKELKNGGVSKAEQYIQQLKNNKDMRFTPQVEHMLDIWKAETNGQYDKNFYAVMRSHYKNLDYGFEKEVIPAVLDILNGMCSDNVNKLCYDVLGDVTSRSAVTTRKANMRADIGITGMQLDKEQLKQMNVPTYKDVELELTEWIDLNGVTDILTNEKLKAYLDDNFDFFGFSVKSWSSKAMLEQGNSTNAKVFMNSKVFQDEFNAIFHTTVDEEGDDGPHRHSWQTAYATMYVSYFLSKYLVNIMSPNQIGFMLSDGILWFKDFLKMCYFFMYITPDYNYTYKEQTGIVNYNRDKKKTKNLPWALKEIYPTIIDSGIYIGSYGETKQELLKNYQDRKLEERINSLGTMIRKKDSKGNEAENEKKLKQKMFGPTSINFKNGTKV